jgi:hypothetical protein
LEKVNASLVKNGICSIAVPELLNIVDVTNSKDNIERLATVKMNVLLIDKDSGETVTITGIGSGQDSGDKAVMKAQTAAIKYAYLLSLAISTGDDPEADLKTDENMQDKNHGEVKSAIVKASISDAKNGRICKYCGASISEKVSKYSMGKYGKLLCMDCQKKGRNIA